MAQAVRKAFAADADSYYRRVANCAKASNRESHVRWEVGNCRKLRRREGSWRRAWGAAGQKIGYRGDL